MPPGKDGEFGPLPAPAELAAVVRAVVVTVSVEVAPAATEAGAKLQLAPAGKPPQVRATVPL
jgi:hypothetical protein